MNQPLDIALVVVTAKLWLHYYTGQTFKQTGMWLTHIKEFGIPPDYHHIHWFSLQSFRSIICCAAVDQNRLSKSSASEEKREFHFPYDTCLCKASLTTHTLSGFQSLFLSFINVTSWQHRARVSSIKSLRHFVLVKAQTGKLLDYSFSLSVKKSNSPCKDSGSMQYYLLLNCVMTFELFREWQYQSIDSWSSW